MEMLKARKELKLISNRIKEIANADYEYFLANDNEYIYLSELRGELYATAYPIKARYCYYKNKIIKKLRRKYYV